MRTCWPFIRWPMPAVKQQSAGTDRRTAHPPRVPWEHGASNRKSHTPAARSNARRRGVLSGSVWLSPRVRGKAKAVRLVGHDVGITPACAGKRDTFTRRRRSRKDHPRVCGEKLHLTVHACIHFGITPACAGKRAVLSCPGLSHPDHPRVCGEKTAPDCRMLNMSGSPPRVRGKGFLFRRLLWSMGITPACAGKRSRPRSRRGSSRDHPRVCGEKASKISTSQ